MTHVKVLKKIIKNNSNDIIMVEIRKWTKQIGRIWYLLHRIAAVMWKVLRILHLESKDHKCRALPIKTPRNYATKGP